VIYYIIESKNDKVFRFNDCRTHSSNDIFDGFPRLKTKLRQSKYPIFYKVKRH